MLSCGCNEPPKPRAPEQNDALLGLAHVNLDVTALCAGSVGELVDAVQARSDAKFGMSIRVLEPPHQRMMGDLVAEAVVLHAVGRAPRPRDGARLDSRSRVGISVPFNFNECSAVSYTHLTLPTKA